MRSRKMICFAFIAALCAGIAARADNPKLKVIPDSLFFRQLTTTPPTSQKVTVTGIGGATLGSFTATATSTGNWLSVSPGSGAGTTTLTVSANTTGLIAGEYSGSIAIAASGFPTATVKVELEILMAAGQATPVPPSVLVLRPGALEFHVTEGGPAPSAGALEIFNPAGDSFSWTQTSSVTTPPGGHWLTVTPVSGTGKAVLQVAVDPTGVSVGNYSGQITVTSGGNTATAKVGLHVEAGRPGDDNRSSKLIVVPQALNFNIEPNATKPPGTRTLEVRSAGRGGPLAWTASATINTPTGGHWLSITPTSGKTPDKITVKVDPTGLGGTYSGKIGVKAGTESSDVQVFLRILGPSKSKVTITPKRLKFTATTGASGVVSPASRVINISSTATGLTFTATASTAKGGAWLTIAPPSGAVPGSITATVVPSIATSLAPGVYTGSVVITVPGSGKPVNTVHVGLKVFGPDDQPRLEVEPGAVAFKATPGGPDPAAKPVKLEPEGAASLAWTSTVSVATPSGGTWLSISPTSGTTTSATPSTVNVSAKIAGLAAGAYHGTVVFTPDPASGAPPVHLNVVLVLPASGATKTATLAVSDLALGGAAVAPGDLIGFFTSPPDGFISDVALPPEISVTVLDSGGSTVEGATVTVSSSNGEPDLLLEDVGGGQYEGSFRALSGGPVTLSGSAVLDAQSATTFAITGDMESSTDQPTVIFQGGAVSAASFAAAPSPLAPGSLVTLFGQNVAGGGGESSSIPLSANLGGVSVTIGGIPAPLLLADPASDQISLQVPFELDGQAQADILVNNNGVLSQPETINIAAAPALFTVSQSGVGPGVFLHQDGVSLITAGTPAAAGEVIVLYATGLGAVLPPVSTGDATSGLSTVSGNVTVSMGGQSAPVQFDGLAPNFVGLYQINVQVPAGLPIGDALVVLSVDGTPATGRATVSLK